MGYEKKGNKKNRIILIGAVGLAMSLGLIAAGLVINEDINFKRLENEKLMASDKIAEDFNDFQVEKNVDKVVYGTSGLGRNLYYYKIGNGERSLLINFGIHGYEDGWDKDGYELVKISKGIVNKLSKTYGDLNIDDWSIYIIPSSNPDGLLDGYTNNGPGRCQITNGIDLNRNFPANFVSQENDRNFNGDEPLSAPESESLEMLVSDISKKSINFVLLDVHGWLNKTIGDVSVTKYFDSEFGFENYPLEKKHTGYLITYGKSIGAEVALIEFPKPEKSADIINRNYEEKLFNGIVSLLRNYKR